MMRLSSAPEVCPLTAHTDFYKGLCLSIGCYFYPHRRRLMALETLLFCSFFLSILSYGRPEAVQSPSELQRTCDQIAAAISGASHVFFPRMCLMYHLPYRKLINVQAAPEYSSDNYHASNLSSEVSTCSVEPGSPEDVGNIVSHPTSMR